ncbi:MAG: transcriptional regulator, LysR family [Ramlibacter sp.]|nr:transcriptional regulator, LysR family [Ramlibacter sp.]
MELRHLRYFQAVAQLESVTQASRKLFVAQPALSLQLRQLEEEVGAQLLTRHARGVTLTPAGRNFLAHASAILEQVERAKQQARGVDEGGGGVVSLAFVPSASHVVIPRLVRELRRTQAGIEIELREMITAQQLEALEADSIDFGLARLPARGRGLHVDAELVDPFCLAVPADHALAAGTGPVTARVLADEPMVGFTRYRAPAFHDQALNACISAGFSPRLRYEASTVYSVLDLVSAGLGVAIVPSTCALLRPEGVVFRTLPAKMKPGSLALVRRASATAPAMAAVAGIVARIFQQLQRDSRKALGAATRSTHP